MIEEKCEVNLKPDKKYGWKIEVTGCSNTLKEIEGNLAEFSGKYFNERVEIKPHIERKNTSTTKPPVENR